MRALRRAGAAAVVAVAALVLLASGASAIPSSSPQGQISDVTAKPGHVQFVFSAGGLPGGAALNPQSVTVTANGTTLQASAAPATAVTQQQKLPLREVMVALDVSGSMQGDGIAAAKSAAEQYANGLPADVRVGLLTFSDQVRTLLAPTADRSKLRQALAGVQAGGNTSLYDGIVAASDLLKNLPADSERRLIILSDGADTSSAHSLHDAVSALTTNNVAADVVAFRLPGDQQVLTAIAHESGGRVLPAASAGDLAAAFKSAAAVFQQRLLISVSVPAALASKNVTLIVTVNAGGASVTGSTQTVFPTVPGGRETVPQDVSAPAITESTTRLWIVTGVAFAAILIAALVGLSAPGQRRARAEKQARLTEMQRYRVVGAVGVDPFHGGSAQPEQPSTAVARGAFALADKTVRARGKREVIVAELDRAGMRMKPEEWVVIQVVAVVLGGGLIALLLGSPLGLLLGGLIGYASCRVFVRSKISRRAATFAEQLPETLQLMAGALRTGFSLNQALAGVVREGTEPTASEFARALAETRLGSELEDAIDGVADRMKCEDLSWVVMAIRISREVGGNLAEVLGTTVVTMRQRVELRGLVKVLSAEGRLSARILIALPLFLAGFLLVFRRGYLNPMIHSGLGIGLLAFGMVMLCIGAVWLNRITKIEV